MPTRDSCPPRPPCPGCPRFGARDLARRLRAELEPALARALLERPGDDTFLALLDDRRVRVVPVSA